MLTRLLRRAAVAAMALVFLAQAPALAGGGPGTGGPFGLAQCGQSSSAQCTGFVLEFWDLAPIS
jgi:hypothetical protein